MRKLRQGMVALIPFFLCVVLAISVELNYPGTIDSFDELPPAMFSFLLFFTLSSILWRDVFDFLGKLILEKVRHEYRIRLTVKEDLNEKLVAMSKDFDCSVDLLINELLKQCVDQYLGKKGDQSDA